MTDTLSQASHHISVARRKGGLESLYENSSGVCHSEPSTALAANLEHKLLSSLAVVLGPCDAGEDALRQAMTDASLAPSCPFLSLVPVL